MCTYVRTAGRQVISAHACSSDPPSSPRKNRQRKKRLICFSAPHPWGGGGLTHAKQLGPHHEYPKNFFRNILPTALAPMFSPSFFVRWTLCSITIKISARHLFLSSPPPLLFLSPLHQPLLGGRVREKRGLLPCNYLSGCLEKRREGRVRIFFFFYLPVCAS